MTAAMLVLEPIFEADLPSRGATAPAPVVIGLDPFGGGERSFDVQWCERSQHSLRHRVVDLDGADAEAVEAALILDPLAGAVITRTGGAAGVMGAQLASADARPCWVVAPRYDLDLHPCLLFGWFLTPGSG